MFKKLLIKQLTRQMVRDVTKKAVKELKKLREPKDFTEDEAYNLLQLSFSFFITTGIPPDKAKDILHKLVDEAHVDFYKQVVEPLKTP
jgi:hypothetical protein